MITLLRKFIDTETSQYIEPVREGTAKGDAIGLSATKYKSTLLFLTNLKGKEIAEAVGVSYGLLRVWRTEPQYRFAIDIHERTFAGLVAKHIVEISKATKATGAMGKDSSFVTGAEINNRLGEDFADIVIYSDRLMSEIYKQLTSHRIYEDAAYSTFLYSLRFIFALRKGYSFPLTLQAAPKPSGVNVNVVRLTIFEVHEALQRPWTPDREKAEQAKVVFLESM